jgi:hypothetical protein
MSLFDVTRLIGLVTDNLRQLDKESKIQRVESHPRHPPTSGDRYRKEDHRFPARLIVTSAGNDHLLADHVSPKTTQTKLGFPAAVNGGAR